MAERPALAAARRLQLTSRAVQRFFASTSSSAEGQVARPSIAPKAAIDLRSIRQDPELYARNCLDRNYGAFSNNPQEIVELFKQWKDLQYQARGLRERNNNLRTKLSHTKTFSGRDVADQHGPLDKETILEEARQLKSQIAVIETQEEALNARMNELAIELPNLTSKESPIGAQPKILEYINGHPDTISPHKKTKSHVLIGTELDLLDFTAASNTSGWGFYFLKNEAALLEQALVQYALSVARQHGFTIVSPPSMVYSHISSACGFRPRDHGGEQQIYTIAQQEADLGKPEISLAGTAEIPFAAMKANTDMEEAQLPLRVVGSSRCYRAEAGSRGVDTKGLYRVHEFTKVEMFGWTLPGSETELFSSMTSIQKQILQSLGLHCRVLEQPTHDLGASATRKQDIEAFFPSRRDRDEGWGELTSTSICTDYQTRRLATRARMVSGGKLIYPSTVNGTALAVPRVLAAILENHWDERDSCVRVPEVLWPWMHGIEAIGRYRR
jgi:seryl-tRNA synthetase